MAFRSSLFRYRHGAVLGVGGALFGAGSFGMVNGFSTASSAPGNVALSPSEYKPFKLVESKFLTHNTKRYRFAFPEEEMISGIETASLLMARTMVDGKEVARPYTPVSRNGEKGFLDLVIKVYPAPGGVMSRHIDSLKPGDVLEMKGPYKKIAYKPNMKRKIGMIAGGTGITPMLQVAREVLDNPADKTEINLIFANVTEEDIILRDEIDALQHLYPNFNVYYTLDRPPAGWTGGKGFVSKEMIEEKIAGKDEDVLVMVCGPNGFLKHVCGAKGPKFTQGEVDGILKELGYNSDQVFKF